jgi:hypothetical protein
MQRDRLTWEHEHTIRCVLADEARATVRILKEIDPFDVHQVAWFSNRLNDMHSAYEALTGYPMSNNHEGTIFVPKTEGNTNV